MAVMARTNTRCETSFIVINRVTSLLILGKDLNCTADRGTVARKSELP